ncbi:hypothetical protein ACNQF7_01455 [Flavobacterium sp. RSP29]|uniref:hypothetical protein n=1 Tax=Flavobacterium sp. RSP29 TaxID=3401731 RepID=UPI003AAA8470
MLNKTINQLYSDADFIKFIYSSFMKEIDGKTFPEKYKMRKMPKETLEAMENQSEAKRILERQLIRDNIYLKYKFDIFENPIVVFYEDDKAKKLKPFKKHNEANNFSQSLLNKGIYSMVILIMNHDIECKVYKD